MIYSGATKNLSALLSHNPIPAINDLLQTNVMDKWFGIKQRYRVCCR